MSMENTSSSEQSLREGLNVTPPRSPVDVTNPSPNPTSATSPNRKWFMVFFPFVHGFNTLGKVSKFSSSRHREAQIGQFIVV